MKGDGGRSRVFGALPSSPRYPHIPFNFKRRARLGVSRDMVRNHGNLSSWINFACRGRVFKRAAKHNF